MSNLWPMDIGKERINSPNTILREQASFLGSATNNLVQGEVIKDKGYEANFRYYFHIVAPSVGNYHYRLMTMYHPIEIYPVHIFVEDSILNELSEHFTVEHLEPYENGVAVRSEEEFSTALKTIFASEKTKKVITSLLSQAVPDWNDLSF